MINRNITDDCNLGIFECVLTANLVSVYFGKWAIN